MPWNTDPDQHEDSPIRQKLNSLQPDERTPTDSPSELGEADTAATEAFWIPELDDEPDQARTTGEVLADPQTIISELDNVDSDSEIDDTTTTRPRTRAQTRRDDEQEETDANCIVVAMPV